MVDIEPVRDRDVPRSSPMLSTLMEERVRLLPLALGTVIEETPDVRRFQAIKTAPKLLEVRLERHLAPILRRSGVRLTDGCENISRQREQLRSLQRGAQRRPALTRRAASIARSGPNCDC